MQVLNNRADEMDLTDIYGVFHLKAAKYTLSVYMAYSRGLTTSWAVKQTSVNLSKQLISSTFADHSTMWLEINKKKETVRRGKKKKNTNRWRLNICCYTRRKSRTKSKSKLPRGK